MIKGALSIARPVSASTPAATASTGACVAPIEASRKLVCIRTCLAHGVALAFEARGECAVVVRLLGGELLLGLLRLLGLLLLLLHLCGLGALAAGGSTGQGARGRANGSPLARIAGDGTNGRT